MVQVLPYVPTFGDRLREMASRAQDQYYAGKEQQKKLEAFKTFSDPNTSDAQKLNAFMIGGGSLSDWLKYKQQQESSAAINEFLQLSGGGKGAPTGGGNVQVSDQDVGGQANEQAIADIEPGPESGSPTAPSQIIKAKKPNVEPKQVDEESIDRALMGIAAKSPQLANPLINLTGQRRKGNLAQERLQFDKDKFQAEMDLKRQELDLKRDKNLDTKRAKIDEDFIKSDEERSKRAIDAAERLHIYNEAEEALASGKVDRFNPWNFFANLAEGSQYEGFFSSADREKIKAASVYFYGGVRELFGGNISNAKMKAVSGKIIDPKKSPEANFALIEMRRYVDELFVKEREIADKIIKQNDGYRPKDFDIKIRDEISKKYLKKTNELMNNALTDGGTRDTVAVRNKKTGDIYDVPVNQLDTFLEHDGEIIEE